MKNTSIDTDKATIMFHQMGAKVKTIHGVVSYVKFTFDENLELNYVYNLTKDDEIYLQRIKPYSFGAGVFKTVNDVIAFIKSDVAKFKNASNSSVFDTFIFNNQKMHELIDGIERLFLEKNVPKDKMMEITDLLGTLDQKILEIYQGTPKV